MGSYFVKLVVKALLNFVVWLVLNLHAPESILENDYSLVGLKMCNEYL